MNKHDENGDFPYPLGLYRWAVKEHPLDETHILLGQLSAGGWPFINIIKELFQKRW